MPLNLSPLSQCLPSHVGHLAAALGLSLGTTANIIRCKEGESIVERSAEYDATARRKDCCRCGWGNEKSGRLNFYANSLTTTTDEVGIKSEEREEGETAPWATEERERDRDVLYREGI